MFAVSTLWLSVLWISVLWSNSTFFCSHRSYFRVRTLLFIVGRSWGKLIEFLMVHYIQHLLILFIGWFWFIKYVCRLSRLWVSYAIELSIGAWSWSYKCGCKAVGHVFRVEEILGQVFMLMFQIYGITEIGGLPQISFQRFKVLIDVCSSPIV